MIAIRKILFYINTLGLGGAERVIANLANQFSNDDFEIHLVTSFPKAQEYTTYDSVNRYYLENEEIITSFIKRNLTRTKKLRQIIQKVKPDVVISFMAEPNFRAIIACLGLSIPVVISVRNDPNKEYGGKKFYITQKILFPLAKGYVFQTEDAKKWFPKKVQDKSIIILNQVDPLFFNTDRKSEEYYVAIGRLSKQKNYPMMIKGFQSFLANNPQEQLYIYSDGEDRQIIQRIIDDNKLNNSIHLMGRTDNVPEILSRAKAFIMTSDYEGMPNAMLEAMSVGLPVIVTDCPCGGPRMIIIHNENGLLIPVGDANALCSSLTRLNSDDGFRKRMGKAAKKTAEQFLPEIVYRQWKKYILKVIGGK